MAPVVIVGGGISGLAAAYDLSRAGLPHILIEKRPRLGGVIETKEWDGCVLECGPDSFLAQKPEALALIGELGLKSEIIGSKDGERKTYIVRRGRLEELPEGVTMFVPTRVMPLVRTPLLGWGTKLRMGLEMLRGPVEKPDRSVSEFVTDHFGRETLDYLAEPLLSGVYGGDPAQLSAASTLPRFIEMERKEGSLARAVVKARSAAASTNGSGSMFRTLKRGLGSLIDAAGKSASVRQGEAETVERAGGSWRVRVNGEWLDASHVVLACPAYAASCIARNVDGELSDLLDKIPYSSSALVSLVFEERAFDGVRAGSGFLVPMVERRRMLACTYMGTKFPNRVPPDKIALRCFFGGTGDPSVLNESDEALVALSRAEMRRIAGLTAEPIHTAISRWPRSMAQYTVGHGARLAEIEARAAKLAGLHLAGNAYTGIGIPDCIRTGRTAAKRIIQAATS